MADRSLVRTGRRGLPPSRRWCSPALLLFALAVLLTGCTASAAADPPVGKVVALRVVRTSKYPSNHIPPFTATITDAARAQKLYAAMLKLPYYPNDVDMACPPEIGIFYDLTFTLSNKATYDVIFEPDSCPSVTLGGSDIRAAWYKSFFQLFAQTVNLPLSQVTPQPRGSGPIAPTPAVLP